MNLTIHLKEERVDKTTNKIATGMSVFRDIKSVKLETIPYGTNKYKVEIVMFLGDKYNKQLITIDNVEKIVADGIMGTLHQLVYNDSNTLIKNNTTDKILEKSCSVKPEFEYPESYIDPLYAYPEYLKALSIEILDTYIHIENNMNCVNINAYFKYLDKSGRAKPDSEAEPVVVYTESGKFKFGKLNQPEEDNPGSEYGEIWRELSEDRYMAFMAILNGVNKWKGDIEAIKHNTNISCGKIWKVEPNKDDQLIRAVSDAEPEGARYIMRLYGGLNGHGDWESYLDGLRTYIKCIKRMPGVDSVDLLETQSDLPDDTFSVLIVVRYESESERNKKKKKDVNDEIDYRELI